MILHKKTCNGSFADRSQYLEPINQAYGKKIEDLAHHKREDNFKRCLSKLSLDDVKAATDRAQSIANKNKAEGKKLITYMGYSYYKDNPALSIHESIQKMLVDCGIIKNPKSSRRKKNNT